MKQFKKILSMLLALVMVLSMIPMSAFATEVGAITVSATTGKSGDEVSVNVAISDNPGFCGLEFTVKYDTTRLEKIEFTKSVEEGFTWSNDGGDKFLLENTTMADTTYNGEILNLKFKIKDDAETGDAEVTIEMIDTSDVNGETVNYTINAGKITVEAAACDHPETETTTNYSPAENGQHTVTVTCSCGETVSETTAFCADEDANGQCDNCGQSMASEDDQYTPDENDAVVYQGTTWPSADGYVSEIGVKDAKGIAAYSWSEVYGQNVAVYVLMDSSKYEDQTTFSTYYLTDGATAPEVDADTLDITMSKHNASDWYMNMESIYYMVGSKYIGATFVPAVYTLDKTELNLEVGAEDKLTASLTYYSGPSDWKSSNEDIVTVDDEGNIKAVAPGTATITANVGEFTATCEVTVVSPQYRPDENDAVVYQGTTWPSADGYVSEIGVKDAKGIAAYSWSEVYGQNVAVYVLMDSSKYEDQTTFSTYYLTGGATAPEVDADTLDITMSKHNASDWYMNMESIYYMVGSKYIGATFVPAVYTLDKTELNLEVGAEDKLTASLTYYSGPSDWESSNPNVVTVDDEGNIKAVAPGTATITATVGEFTATCEVTVVSPQYRPDENDAVVYQGTTWPSADGYVSEIGVKDAKGIAAYSWSEVYGQNVAVYVLMDSSKYEDQTTFSTYYLTGGATAPEVDADTLDITMSKHNASDWYMNMESIYYMVGSKYIGATFVPAVYTLDKTELNLEVGAENKLTASLTYYSGPSDWESSNPNVVTVDDEGNIKAVAPGTATITATVGEFTATCEVNVTEPIAPGYTVTMPGNIETVVGQNVQIPVTVGHTDSEVTVYNSFDMSFEFDASVLELTSTEIEGMTVNAENGVIHVERYGTDLNVGGTALTLTFRALAAGESDVKVTAAKVGVSETAHELDADPASIIDDTTKVTVSGYTVTLPGEFAGASTVLPENDYTFTAKDLNYEYTITAKIGDKVLDVTGSGTEADPYKITAAQIDGNIDITTKKSGKKFAVTTTKDISGETEAQYMVNYTATLTKNPAYSYDIKVTVGEVEYKDFTYAESTDETGVVTGTITISGAAITGAIDIKSGAEALPAQTFTVTFEGDGAGQAVGAKTVQEGTDYTFTINNLAGVTYNVTYKMGNAVEAVELTPANGTYTIENVTGNIVVNIGKITDLAVEVTEYVTLDSKTMFLVTATQTLAADEALSYDGTVMFWSEQYNAWSYLVITESTLSVDDAKAKITHGVAEKTSLAQTFNVNETQNDSVDINDAQLVFDMYNNEYQDFSVVTMKKFLKADVSGDKKIDVNDAVAIVTAILAGK